MAREHGLLGAALASTAVDAVSVLSARSGELPLAGAARGGGG